MRWIETLVLTFLSHPFLVSFFGSMLGEEVALFLSVLAGNGLIKLWIVAVFGFLGISIHDAVVYYIGRTGWDAYQKRRQKVVKRRGEKPSLLSLERLVGQTYLLPLIISKFIYGTRVALVVYISHKEKDFFRFLRQNTIALAVWFVIMIPVGWFAGKGFSYLLQVAQYLEKFLAAIILVIILIVIVSSFAIRKLMKKKSVDNLHKKKIVTKLAEW